MDKVKIVEPTSNQSFGINEDEEIEIQSGQYWRLTKSTLYKKGTILLIASLNIIDEILHSLELSIHPVKTPLILPNSDNNSRHRISYNDFINEFEFVPLELALFERENEIQEENNIIDETRSELLIGYVDKETGISAKEIIENIVNKDSSSVESLPLRIGGNVKDYENKANEITKIANKQKEFIGGKNEIIKKATLNLASYYQEKGEQALASVDSTMKYVAKLTKGIETLSLFTGKGVHITKLRGGEDAAFEEPITFYQRKLYFDEETYFEIKLNGKDADDDDSFNQILQEDISYIERMIPAKRGVVLMQFRRKEKEYLSLDSIRSTGIMEKSFIKEKDETCQIRFLLVRNGENVYKIDCDDFFQAQRLFPTAVEMDSFFKKNSHRNLRDRFNGVDFGDGNVNPNDLSYVEARSSHDAKAIFYKRVLIILSGIHSRDTKIFGNFKGSAENIGSWYNLDFQRKSCKFIHDDEDALDDNIESIGSWLERKQNEIMGGSRLLCQGERMINEESSPMAVKYMESGSYGAGYSRSGGNYVYFTPKNKFDMTICLEKKNSLYVKLECDPTFRSSNSTSKMINIKLDKLGRRVGTPYIVLDAIDLSELEYYLNSRKHREDYLGFADLLLEAKVYVEKDYLAQKDFLKSFKEHIFNIYTDSNKELLMNKINEAINLYRIGNNGENLPKLNDLDFIKNMNKISKILDKLLHSEDIIESIINSIKSNYNQEVLQIAINNKGDYTAYTKKEQKYSILNDEENVLEAHVYKIKIIGKNNDISTKQLKDAYYEKLLNEKIIYKNNLYKYANSTNRNSENTKNYCNISKNSFNVFEDIDNSINNAKQIFNDMQEDGIKIDVTKKLLQTWITKNKNTTRFYKRLNFSFPVALVGVGGACEENSFNEKNAYINKSYLVAYAQIHDIADFITHYGDDESFKYLFTQLLNLRFDSVAKDYERTRLNNLSSKTTPFSLFANIHHFDDVSNLKLSSNFGFYKEEFYYGTRHTYVGRFHNLYGNEMRDRNKSLVELLEYAKDKLFKGDHRNIWTNKSFKILNQIENIDDLMIKI